MKQKRLSAFLAALTAVILLSGCGRDVETEWEDTLPSAVTTTAQQSVSVIEAETTPPISISVPEVTTTTGLNTELATSVSTSEHSSETTTSTASSQFTTSVTNPTEQTSPFSSETPYTTVSSSETTTSVSTSETTVTTTETVIQPTLREDGEYIFVKGKPIEMAYPYETLSEDKKKVYSAMVKAMKAHESKVIMPEDSFITGDDYVELYQMIFDFEYSIFDLDVKIRYSTRVSDGRVASGDLSYLYTAEQVEDMQREIDAEADKIIALIDENMSEYEIIKLFYDKLSSEIEYNENAENLRDIYGAFVDKSTVCGGYSKAFSYLCSKIGIESLTIMGDFNETPHMWNMVKINDEWFHVDVTAGNVANSEYQYTRYDYFCVDDDTILKYHTVYEEPFEFPKAASDKRSYYNYYNLIADDVPSAANLIAEEIIKASETKCAAVQFICRDEQAYNDIVFYLFDSTQRHVLEIYENAYDSALNKYSIESIGYNSDPKTRIIKLFLKYTE